MNLQRAPSVASLTGGTQVLRGGSWGRPQLELPRHLVYKKIIKPLMEKRRRGRIALGLSQLKALLLGAPGQGHKKRLPNSRLDKAALLEKTVERIQTLHRAAAEDEAFHTGYSYCASLVRAFLVSETGQQLEPFHPSASISSSTHETSPPASSKPKQITRRLEDTPGSAGLRHFASPVLPSIPNAAGPQLFWRPWST